MMTRYSGRVFSVGAAGAALLLAGCASLPPDRGASVSQALLQSRSAVAGEWRDGARSNEQLASLLTQPLDADAAVKVALLNNARMQSLYAQLGLAQADVYDASRLSNPGLGYMRATTHHGDDLPRTTWTLTQSFTELLFLRYRTRIGRSELLQAQQRVAYEVLGLEADVRAAYYRYVAATLIMQLHEQAWAAATAASDYAQGLFDAGNISELQLSREQADVSIRRTTLQAARSELLQARAELSTLLGLPMHSAEIQPRFIERLPLPMPLQLDAERLRQSADTQRLDLVMLREQVKLLATTRQHTGRWRWVGAVELQAEKERDTDGAELRGFGGSIEVPLFNQGGGKALRARAQYEMAQANLQALQLGIANRVTAQADVLEQSWQRVDEYRQRLIPLRERIVDLSQREHNFMFIGTFELLAIKHEALAAYQDYLRAIGDYWVHYTELARTAGGRLPDDIQGEPANATLGAQGEPLAPDTTPANPPQDHTMQHHPSSSDSHEHPMGDTP